MRVRTGAWLAVLGLAVSGLVAGARAQEEDEDAIPRPVSIYLSERPRVTLQLRGAHGPLRVTGILEEVPTVPLRLVDATGSVREAAWSELRSLSQQDFPAEGAPTGSYVAFLQSDVSGPSGLGIQTERENRGHLLRLLRLPEGNLRLRGAPYGTLNVPLASVRSLTSEAVRGNVTRFPQGNVRLEVLEGATVSIPLESIQWMQRNPRTGTASITLFDQQQFTGRVVELPKVSFELGEAPQTQEIPLDRIAVLERPPLQGIAR